MENVNSNQFENVGAQMNSSQSDEDLCERDSDESYVVTKEDEQIETRDLADDVLGSPAQKRVHFSYYFLTIFFRIQWGNLSASDLILFDIHSFTFVREPNRIKKHR